MKRAQSTLDGFLKKSKTENQEVSPSETQSSANVSVQESYAVDFFDSNDIGKYIDLENSLTDRTKFELLKKPWRPPANFLLPFSTHFKQEKEEKRFLKQSHLDNFNWLVYSDAKKGVFCKYCSLFTVNACGSRKQVPFQKLVKEPLTSFAKLLGKDGALIRHEKNEYHRNAVEAAKNFLTCYNSPETSVLNKLNSEQARQIEENRKRLKPIIESIFFLGKQNIPFRGHRDDGKLNADEGSPVSNDGNFRELLRYRINGGDEELAKL